MEWSGGCKTDNAAQTKQNKKKTRGVVVRAEAVCRVHFGGMLDMVCLEIHYQKMCNICAVFQHLCSCFFRVHNPLSSLFLQLQTNVLLIVESFHLASSLFALFMFRKASFTFPSAILYF